MVSLDFTPSAGMIYLHVDASTTIGWGGILSQMQSDGRIRPARYESGIWSTTEKYDAVKLECRGLLKALKKFRFWLYGRYFTLETDAQTLVWLLYQPPNDLPNAMMTRWLTYIRLFDFDVKQFLGPKMAAPMRFLDVGLRRTMYSKTRMKPMNSMSPISVERNVRGRCKMCSVLRGVPATEADSVLRAFTSNMVYNGLGRRVGIDAVYIPASIEG